MLLQKLEELVNEYLELKRATKRWPVPYIEVDANHINEIVRKSFPNVKILWHDLKYRKTTIEEWKKIIVYDLIDLRNWIRDYFDCDKFARYYFAMLPHLFGLNTIGYVLNYTGRHAFNLIITCESAYIFEPQTDQLWTKETLPKTQEYQFYYKVDGEVLLI